MPALCAGIVTCFAGKLFARSSLACGDLGLLYALDTVRHHLIFRNDARFNLFTPC
jgi:hypothetical protein